MSRYGRNTACRAASTTASIVSLPDAFAGMHPLQRLATEDEIASLVLYLASAGAAFIHGATIAVDGGWSAQ